MTVETDSSERPGAGPAGSRIPVTVITGFLGSGKTSLLNRALRAPEMAHTLVVINEFGEVSLDHALAASSDDAVVVLENGCLCCTVRSDLVGTLNNLYHAREAGEIPRFESVVIETSGLADPGPVLQAFLSEPTLDGLYRVASVVALIDAVNGLENFAQHGEAVRQAALAGRILITKLDLMEPAQAAGRQAELRQILRRINPAAEIGLAGDPALPIPALFKGEGFDPADPGADPRPWLNAEAYEAASHAHETCEEHDHRHDLIHRGIESFCLIREEPMTRAELQFLLDGIAQNLGPGLLRVKGLVNVAEEPGRPAVIQGAQHLLHTMSWLGQWPDADRRTRIVFITQGVAQAALKDMIGMLGRVAARTAKARLQAAEASRAPESDEPSA
jgi:G3E family GTPase